MEGKHIWLGIFIILLVINSLFLLVFAQGEDGVEVDDGDIIFLGLELEKLMSFINGILAFILFLITFIAYKRDHRTRFLYVSIAFLLFAVRSFLLASELFIEEVPLLDPIATALDLIILLTFFFGILRK